MTRIVRIAVTSFCVALALTVATGAEAACHAFTVSVDPPQVDEGGSVTVTVERDAAVNPSSIRVRTVDGSAQAPGDYEALDEQVEFTTGTSQNFEVAIADDAQTEGAETFTVQLSEPGGCAVNQSYTVGDPATVTITASDPSTPTPEPVAPATQAPAPTPTVAPMTASPTPVPSTPAVTSGTPTLSPTPTEAMEDETSTTSGAGWVVAGAVVAVVLAGAGATMLWLRRAGRL